VIDIIDVSFWNLPLADILQGARVNIQNGLSRSECALRLQIYGLNSTDNLHRTPLWLQFISRFRNPLIILLLAASALSAITGDKASFIIIVTIVIFSVVLDFIQSVRAEKIIDSLRHSVALKANVLRDGKTAILPMKEIVPGDIILLSPGMLIPADGRLISGKDIYVNQSILTGESLPVEKIVQDLTAHTDDITDATNAVFMGTSMISGSGMMVAIDTGKNTRFGQLAGTLVRRPPPTAFERGVEKFGLLLLRIAIVMVLFVLLVNIGFHRPVLESFLFALALAIGLAPELLPMIVTITLSKGARRMAQEKVIVKHLPAMHNLGAMDILCTDKTGTLTEANIRLTAALDTAGNNSDHVFLLGYLNSSFESGIKAPLDEAILQYDQPNISTWAKLDEVPFDFERRRLSVLVEQGNQRLLIVKGAPEDILKLSTHYEMGDQTLTLNEPAQETLRQQLEKFGKNGLRVLGVAYRAVDKTHTTASISDETELVFAGFLTFIDPPKASADTALQQLAAAGITVKIISGDNEHVTHHLCDLLGFDTGEIITGGELVKLSDEALLARIDRTHVFCRVTPQQKSRVIQAYKTKQHVVGFLGDGINDAAALHIADVGISVDSASDVAKEAADIILLEHDLSVIINGVTEGRRAVLNTEKYILMGSSSTFGNMFSMAGGVLFLPFLPMLPIQVLLNNLLYDFSQTAVPFDYVDSDALLRPTRWNLTRVQHFMWVLGPASSLFDFLTFYILLQVFHADEKLFHTGWFLESIITQTLIIFAIRTRKFMFRSRPHCTLIITALVICAFSFILPYTPLGEWFGFAPLPGVFFAFLSGALLAYFALVEGIKFFFRRYIA